MKGMSRKQLEAALTVMGHGPTKGEDNVILEETMKTVFNLYGDDYFADRGACNEAWELCNENPVWDEARKGGTITIRKGHKVR